MMQYHPTRNKNQLSGITESRRKKKKKKETNECPSALFKINQLCINSIFYVIYRNYKVDGNLMARGRGRDH